MSLIGNRRLSVIAANRAPQTAHRGLTLIEAMVAVVILSAGLIAIGRANMVSIGALGIGRESMEAFSLLKEKMGEIELRALEEGGLSPEASNGNFGGGFGDYEWQTDIKSVSDKLTEVEIEVRRRGSQRIWTLATYADAKE